MNYYYKDFDIFTSKTKGSKVLYIPDKNTLAKEDAGFCSSNKVSEHFS